MIETITIRLNLVYEKGHHPISDTKLDHVITSLQRNSDQTGVQNLTIATQINCHVDLLPLLEAQGAFMQSVEVLRDDGRSPIYRMRFQTRYDANSRTCLGDVISVFTQGIDRESKAPPNIWSFLRGCSSLKSVHLAGISSLNMEVILELLSRGLQELHLIGCDVKSLEAFSIFGSLLQPTHSCPR